MLETREIKEAVKTTSSPFVNAAFCSIVYAYPFIMSLAWNNCEASRFAFLLHFSYPFLSNSLGHDRSSSLGLGILPTTTC